MILRKFKKVKTNEIKRIIRPTLKGKVVFFSGELLKIAKKDKKIIARILKDVCLKRLDFENACKFRDIERKENEK